MICKCLAALLRFLLLYTSCCFSTEVFRKVCRNSGKNLPRGQPSESAHVFSTFKLLEERERRCSSDC